MNNDGSEDVMTLSELDFGSAVDWADSVAFTEEFLPSFDLKSVAEDAQYEMIEMGSSEHIHDEHCGGGHEDAENLAYALQEGLRTADMLANPLELILEVVDPTIDKSKLSVSPGELFNSFVYGDETASHLHRFFEVLAYPGERAPDSLQEGDMLLRRGPAGETFVALLTSGELKTAAELTQMNAMTESVRSNGRYAAVAESRAFPHLAGENFYRRITNANEILPRIHLLLRPVENLSTSEWSDAETIPSSRLRWSGATAAQLAFMRQVYNAHVTRSSRRRTFQPDVPAAQLGLIENGHQARTAAAQACRNMLAAARHDIASNPALQRRVTNIGITSGYRSASRQFNIWQRNFPRYYRETITQRSGLTGGVHGSSAVALLTRYIGRRVGAPGFSLHNDGRAVDLTATENGRRIAADTSAANIRIWRASWFYQWLAANAARFNFHENRAIDEPWHWEHRPTQQPAPPSPTPARRSQASTSINWCQMRNTIAQVARTEEIRWTKPDSTKFVESEASQLPILEQYWRSVPGFTTTTAATNAASQSANNTRAWSAAFICFVMRTAGVQPVHGFDFSQRHLNYIVGALRNRERSDRNRVFWLADQVEVQHEAIPQPGDLLCFNRLARGRMTTHSYSSLRRAYWLGGNQNKVVYGSSHCSLVVGHVVRNGNQFVQFIGGNENQSVRLREMQLNQSGGISNPAAHNIFGIIKLIGC